jgi:hypothetical protein
MPGEPTTSVRVSRVLIAVVGTVLLVGACFVTVVEGAVLTPWMMTDSCSPADFGPGGPPACRNADTVTTIVLVTAPVAFLVGTVGAWWPVRKYRGYVPSGWLVVVGIIVLATAWFVADWLVPGWFF